MNKLQRYWAEESGIYGLTTDDCDMGETCRLVCKDTDVSALEAENERLRRLGIEEVMAEVGRATVKFPTWPTDPLHALAVLGEEFGELTKAMLQHTYEPEKSTLEDVHEEAIQTAAMALRLVKSLNVYEYRKGFQHVQAILNREQEKQP